MYFLCLVCVCIMCVLSDGLYLYVCADFCCVCLSACPSVVRGVRVSLYVVI